MGGEKQSSKSGRYVGGFLQLFDWNQKSRKKLFSGKSDISEVQRHGRRSEGNSPITRVCMFDDEEIVGGLSIRVGSEYSYSCASSVTDEDGHGTKAPSVVARLMGLDSLPTSNTSEPYSSPQFEIPSLGDAPPFRRKELNLYQKYQDRLSENIVLKPDGPSHYASSEPKNPKIVNRAIHKFQTEILPPKSAKSIPHTHNKLLSPIRNPGFHHSKDAAQIMEAAARIIEPGPQTSTRTKISSSSTRSSSSVPLRVQEMREKLEASQRSSSRATQMLRRPPVESNAAKCLKGQSMNKSWNGSVETSSKSSCDAEDSSFTSKNKGRSISLAVQAKVNVQKRGLSRSGRNSEARKEEDEVRSATQQFKSHPNNQRTSTHKKASSSLHNTSTVLKQNNQKQNCRVAKDNLHSKLSAPSLHVRKGSSGYHSSTSQQQQNLNKDPGSIRMGGSRKSSLEIRDHDRDALKNVPRKKRSIDGNLQQHERNHNNNGAGKSEKLFQSSMLPDSHLPWAEETMKKGMDVVSFTFTAPMTRSMPSSDPSSNRLLSEKNNSAHFTENRNKKAMLSPDSPKLSFLGHNNKVTGGDALSVLLEQKLKELTHAVEPSSPQMFVKSGRFESSTQQNAIFSSGEMTHGTFQGMMNPQLEMQMDKTPVKAFPSCSTEPEIMRKRFNLQAVEEIDACSSSKPEIRPLSDRRYPSPDSILESTSMTESCNSSDSVGSNLTEECKQQQLCSSVQGQEIVGLTYTETDLTDSASSTKLSSSHKAVNNSREWELMYIKEILSNVELMFNDYALGRTSKIINPRLFNQLEKMELIQSGRGEESKLKRRALFDCISECLELRCQVFVEGGSTAWAKGVEMVRRKDRLAEEIHKDIETWRRMGDCMVDELVEKDMGSKYGNWLDFEVDGFGVGGEAENLILEDLIDKVVSDVLAASFFSQFCI